MIAVPVTPCAATSSQPTNLSINSAEAGTDGERHFSSNITIVTADTNHMPNKQLNANYVASTTLSPCNPTDIMPRLIKAHRKRAKIGFFIFMAITLVCIVATSICFIFVKRKATENENISIPLTLGILGSIPSIIFLIFFCYLCHSLCKGSDWMNRVQQIIQIDGEIWQNQIDSVRNTVPTKEMHIFCQGDIYNRLKARQHGYIVIAEDGIIIDELFIIPYHYYVVHRIDLIDNTRQTGCILRINLVTRISLELEIDKGTQISFDVCLFMAPHMQINMLTDIRQNILTNSHRCLAAAGFDKNSATINIEIH